MRFAGSQTVYPCKEHEAVEIPIQTLLGPDGRLDIYSDVADKGYFDVDYRAGRLALRATRYIGLIPISDSFAIHVEPKAPVPNLMRMISRAGTPLTGIPDFIRGYEQEFSEIDNPEELYIRAFLSAAARVSSMGILKRYVERKTDRELRGRLLLAETVGRFRSRGITYRAIFDIHDLTVDNPENRIIKHTAERLLRHFTFQPNTQMQDVARPITQFLVLFSAVDSGAVDADFIARTAPALIRGLPTSYHFYEPLLWLAYLISTGSGVAMERIGAARFESIVVDASQIFERYVRRVIEDAMPTAFPGISVFDGNVEQVPLFVDNQAVKTQPDYFFRYAGKPVAVADAKYKLHVSATDRYELLAFCEALGVSAAAFVLPSYESVDPVVHHGTTASGKRLQVIKIDLSSRDMDKEERTFIARLGKALELN